jgi:hypothetical protein
MSCTLWQKLPCRFLKIGEKAWGRRDLEIRRLIVELAEKQKFQCAFCDRNQNLEIEHDHDPELGPGGKTQSIYNIRGLVCRGCNWALMIYERDESGAYRGWDNVDSSCISRSEYEDYIYSYRCRVAPIQEAMRERRMGSRNYWRWRHLTDKLDDFQEYGGNFPWVWGFDEIKEKRHGLIRTPKQFMRTILVCTRFVNAELERNPNYDPPEGFFYMIARVKPMLDNLRPLIEERMKTMATAGSPH